MRLLIYKDFFYFIQDLLFLTCVFIIGDPNRDNSLVTTCLRISCFQAQSSNNRVLRQYGLVYVICEIWILGKSYVYVYVYVYVYGFRACHMAFSGTLDPTQILVRMAELQFPGSTRFKYFKDKALLEKALKFIFEISKLQRLKRTGWVKCQVRHNFNLFSPDHTNTDVRKIRILRKNNRNASNLFLPIIGIFAVIF